MRESPARIAPWRKGRIIHHDVIAFQAGCRPIWIATNPMNVKREMAMPRSFMVTIVVIVGLVTGDSIGCSQPDATRASDQQTQQPTDEPTDLATEQREDPPTVQEQEADPAAKEEAEQKPTVIASPQRSKELLVQYEGFLDELKKPAFVRLSPDHEIWIHPKKKAVVVSAHICLRQGQLEMFACPRRSKEHESLVSVHAKSSLVHAGLLAIGAKVGKPVQYQPEYKPARGTIIDVFVLWKDRAGESHAVKAQDWIRDWKTKKAMKEPWVFAGSQFWVDPVSKKQYYSADSGELICVSNFSTATLDIPVQSSQSDAALLFEAFTERLPPLRTDVRLIFAPRQAKKPDKPAAATASGDPDNL